MHGSGTFTDATGHYRSGIWENDKRIEWVSEESTIISSLILHREHPNVLKFEECKNFKKHHKHKKLSKK